MPGASFDYLIVGGGTAGCVLAARLSEKPEHKVLLVEAGADYEPGREPASIRDPFPASYGDPAFSWPNLIAEIGADPGNQQPRFSRRYVQGRGIGGSSSIMGMMATRGLPADYDEWLRLGATGWGWEGVLPFFKRFENDLDFNGPLHSKHGPMPIRRNPRASWPPLCRAFAEVLEDRGYAFLADFNGQFADGVGAIPMNNLPDRRVSTAMAYLTAEVRRRPNLRISSNTTVETLVCRERRVVGVTLRSAAGLQTVNAHETIVCAGALHTPTILLRSGIGSGAALHSLGIDVVADLPGVGQNLQNHPAINLGMDLRPHARQAISQRTWSFSALRFSSNHPECPPCDMQMNPMNKTSWHPLGRRIGVVGVSVYKSFSRGEVSLKAADPQVPPSIKMNLLADRRDFDRLVGGMRMMLSLLADPRIVGLRNEVFVPPGGHANALNRPSPSNWLKASLIKQLFGFGAMRRRALKALLLEPAKLLSDAQALEQLVRRTAAPVHHVCGTCKIGPRSDPSSVLDPSLRVYGVEGLRVADAAIMPTIVAANTHLPVVMIAEKAADLILSDKFLR